MTTRTNGGDKEAAPTKRRRRDSHAKTKPSKDAVDRFVEHFATHSGKGVISDAAQAAYPDQNRASAGVTGSRLLSDPKIQARIQERRERMAKAARTSREQIIALLEEMAFASLMDVLDDTGDLNLLQAIANGQDHLLSEIVVTDRHSKDGSSRRTTKYKLNDRIKAMDLLSELRGWKREPQKNPIDVAREGFRIMRQKEIYKDMPDRELAAYQAQYHDVSVDEILAGIENNS